MTSERNMIDSYSAPVVRLVRTSVTNLSMTIGSRKGKKTRSEQVQTMNGSRRTYENVLRNTKTIKTS